MMGITRQSAKAKGRAGEMEILAMLSNIIKEEYSKRGWPWPEHGVLRRGPNGKDIVGLAWLAPEVKRHETINDYKLEMFWAQAKENAKNGADPVLLWRQNNSCWKVRMFGKLVFCDGGAVRCPVDITYEDFLLWFKHKLARKFDELAKASATSAPASKAG
jgi:hypothetical protein